MQDLLCFFSLDLLLGKATRGWGIYLLIGGRGKQFQVANIWWNSFTFVVFVIRNRFQFGQKILQVECCPEDRTMGWGAILRFSICMARCENKYLNKYLNKNSKFGNPEVLEGPGCVVPPRQGPESGKRLGRLHIPSMSTIWALSWDIKTFLNPKYLNKTFNFHKFQLLQHFCSKNWTCSPRTSMHSTNQVKLQTHSFSTVPVPLRNSK